MIRLSKHIYIHWLTVFLFICSYITRSLENIFMMYSVMLLHELSHTIAAVYLRLGVSRIIFYPFGVSVTLKTRALCSLNDSIILYLSGPSVNAVIVVVLALTGIQSLFAFNNLAVFMLNLLPVLPLDGGRLLESILLRIFSERKTRICINIVSIVIAAGVIAFIAKYCAMNINTVTFIIFMLGNTLMQKPKYNRDLLREMCLTEKKSPKTNVLMVNSDASERDIVKLFSPQKHTLIFRQDDNGAVTGIQTDREVIFNIIR